MKIYACSQKPWSPIDRITYDFFQACVLMKVVWTRVHATDAPVIASDARDFVTCPAHDRFRVNIVPHGIKKRKGEYITWGSLTLLRYCPNPITRAH